MEEYSHHTERTYTRLRSKISDSQSESPIQPAKGDIFLAQGASPGNPRTARLQMLLPLAGSLSALKATTGFNFPITPSKKFPQSSMATATR